MARARPQTQLSLAWFDTNARAATELAGRRTETRDGHSGAATSDSGHTTGDGHILLTVAEVARTLNIGRRQAWEMIWRGDLPIVRLGPRTVRVARSVLEEYVVVRSRPYGS
jgi:excisionase family DNA binding protein